MGGTKPMTDRQRHDVLRRMLEERRTEIQEKLRVIREEIPSYQDEVRDSEEQSVTDFAQEMDFALMEMKARTLVRIDEALQRVDQGTYGTCDHCGQDIAAARLSAVPFALLCLECQEREEALAAEERAQTPGRALAPIL
jgi:RNA polymerase-binding transcription factor